MKSRLALTLLSGGLLFSGIACGRSGSADSAVQSGSETVSSSPAVSQSTTSTTSGGCYDDRSCAAAEAAVQNAPATTYPVSATVVVAGAIGHWNGSAEDSCVSNNGSSYGESNFGDIQTGAQVTFRDEFGTVVGVGQLQPGVIQGDWRTGTCRFDFNANVRQADFYQITVGQQPPTTLERAQLLAGFTLNITNR